MNIMSNLHREMTWSLCTATLINAMTIWLFCELVLLVL